MLAETLHPLRRGGREGLIVARHYHRLAIVIDGGLSSWHAAT